MNVTEGRMCDESGNPARARGGGVSCSAGREGFTVLELMGALAVFLMLYTCFFASARALRQIHAAVEDESDAVVVLHNVATRLAAEKAPDVERAQTILYDEYGKSVLCRDRKLMPVCEAVGEDVRLGVGKVDGRIVLALDWRPAAGVSGADGEGTTP